MAFDTERFEISLDESRVFNVAAHRVQARWRVDSSVALDDALPFPWPEKYLTSFRQPFNPHGFFVNAAALAGEFLRTKDPEIQRIALGLHARLREYSVLDGNARYVVYRFPKSYRRIIVVPPWTSGYASGAALIGLTLLADVKLVPEAAQDAREILAGMAEVGSPGSREELWVSFVDIDGCLWFEEMPLPQPEQPRILNGHIRALTGLYLYWVRQRDEQAHALLCAGILTIKRHAMDYRRPGDVNAYDLLSPAIADYGPDRTVAQQDILFRMTGDPTFAAYRDTFAADIAASRGAQVSATQEMA